MMRECRIIFQGSKLFWRTRNSIHVTIVQHLERNTTEIIAYDPSFNVESKRIYLNSDILRTKLDQAEIDSTIRLAKQKDVPISTDSIINHAISEFILSRLIISESKSEECRFEVNLHFWQSDRMSNFDDLVCVDIAELQPYETEVKNSTPLAPGVVDATLKALEDDKRSLKANRHQAAVLEAEVRAALSSKQRWRIPLVLIKMDKGKVLNEGDAKIWESVSRSMKTQADIERVAVMTTKRTTTEAQLAAKKALKGAKPPVSMPGSAPPAILRAHSRLLAGTATSQTRTHCVAEDNAAAPSIQRANSNKPIKRSSSNRALHGHGKGLRRAKSRLAASRENSVSNLDTSDSADHPIEHPDALDNSASAIAMGENMHPSFASQVAAGLSSFVESLSAKLKPGTASLKSGGTDGTPSTQQGSSRILAISSTEQEPDTGVPAELPTLQRHLSDLVSYLTSGKSKKTKQESEKISFDVHALPSMSAKKQLPGKRRSFAETLLAMLVREDSIQASAPGNAPDFAFFTHYIKPVQQGTFDLSEEVPLQDASCSTKPSSLTMHSWFPWRRGSTSSTKVVPVNLVEYARAQFVE